MTDNGPVYTNERLIGHHIRAEVPEPSDFRKWLDEIADEFDIPRNAPEFVEITESDVDWDESRKIRLTRRELQELAARFPP